MGGEWDTCAGDGARPRAYTPHHLVEKSDTLDYTFPTTGTAYAHTGTHLLGLRVIMTFRLCTAPPSVLPGHEVCKWRVIHFAHSGAGRLHSDVCYRAISSIKAAASPNIRDKAAIDPLSCEILTPVSGFINGGDVSRRAQTLCFAAQTQRPVTVASALFTRRGRLCEATSQLQPKHGFLCSSDQMHRDVLLSPSRGAPRKVKKSK